MEFAVVLAFFENGDVIRKIGDRGDDMDQEQGCAQARCHVGGDIERLLRRRAEIDGNEDQLRGHHGCSLARTRRVKIRAEAMLSEEFSGI